MDEGIDNTHVLSNPIFQDEEKMDGCWTLEFNGAHSSSRSGVRVVFISLDKEVTFFSYRLKFDCTNNIVEYGALILGLNITIDTMI